MHLNPKTSKEANGISCKLQQISDSQLGRRQRNTAGRVSPLKARRGEREALPRCNEQCFDLTSGDSVLTKVPLVSASGCRAQIGAEVAAGERFRNSAAVA